MKEISAALSDHLDQEVTTLCSCWKIVRRDGVVFGFTDHDRDIFIDDVLYEAEASYNRTAIATSSDFSVANLDVSGILDSDRMTEYDLRAGLFNRADVYVFVVNWADLSQGILRVRRGWFGEVSLLNNGTFTTEIRGLAQALSHNFIEVYSPECRADFCDSRCKLNIADFTNSGTVTSSSGFDSFAASALPDAPTTGTSAGAHKTWAIHPYGFPLGQIVGIAEVRLWDQQGNLIEGGRVTDMAYLVSKDKSIQKALNEVDDASEYDYDEGTYKEIVKGRGPKKARDARMDTGWRTTLIPDTVTAMTDIRLIFTFDTPVDVKTVEIITPSRYEEAPTAFTLEYTDDDIDAVDRIKDLAQARTAYFNLEWGVAKDCSHVFTAAGQSAIWGLGSGDDTPINIADVPVDIPPPYNSVSTYEGGTIKWLSGRNMGRVVEITDYADDTNTVTLFEGMSYAIAVGDTFEITQGCDRSLARCKLYNNVINRRAEDYIPGNDEYMKYPDAK